LATIEDLIKVSIHSAVPTTQRPRKSGSSRHVDATSPVGAIGSTGPEPVHDPFERDYLPSLDGMRFLAVILVVFYHGGITIPIADGVTFFFVLSGFLFAWLLDREYASTGTIQLKKFYIRRIIRIFPAFYCAIALTIVGKLALGNQVDYEHAVWSGLFAGNYFNALNDHPASGFAHFWSLAVEEQFYLIWPITFLLLARLGRRVLIGALCLSIVVVCSWRSWLYLVEGSGSAYVYNAFECRFDSLAIGCLCGMLIRSPWFRGGIRRLCRVGIEPCFVMLILCFSTQIPENWHYSLGMTVDSFLLALLILQFIQLGDHALWKWLNRPQLRFLGTLSYSAYLLHSWGLAIGSKLTFVPLIGQILIALVATMMLAYVQYRLVERPALALRKRFGSHVQQANAVG